MSNLKLTPIRKVGEYRQGTLTRGYEEITEKLGPPNTTDLGDESKVKAAWAIQDEKGRELCIWCYKYPNPKTCRDWSFWGSSELAAELFGITQVRSE